MGLHGCDLSPGSDGQHVTARQMNSNLCRHDVKMAMPYVDVGAGEIDVAGMQYMSVQAGMSAGMMTMPSGTALMLAGIA